jgi:hypothetical protein
VLGLQIGVANLGLGPQSISIEHGKFLPELIMMFPENDFIPFKSK